MIKNILQLQSPNCTYVCVLRALDVSPSLKVRSVEGTRRIRVESWSRVMTCQKHLTVLSRRRFAPAISFHEEEAAVGGKRPRGSRERVPVHVQCEPKDNDEVAHQQLLSDFAMSFEERLAQQRLQDSKSRD